jgi:hypothetical protein
LSKKESFSLGFIPKMAYEAAITGIKKGKRWSPVCNDNYLYVLLIMILLVFALLVLEEEMLFTEQERSHKFVCKKMLEN